MADGLARILSKPGFDPENFVKKVSQQGEEDLRDMRKQINSLADETAVALKKNVYKNYSQFIETAKEISILESEMYQLSHMLMDQKSIMTQMMETSITSDKVEGPEGPSEPETPDEEDTQNTLGFLLEKVEGCSTVMEVPGRQLIHDGDLVELDPESFTHIAKVHAFLLNDSLMFASWLPHRHGPVKYKYQCLYELDSLAVVNARDVGQCRNAFKILMFPDTRMFQAESPKAKRQWLDILEETKKKKAALESQRKEAAQERMSQRMSSRISGLSLDDKNPFAEKAEDIEEEEEEEMASVVYDVDLLHEAWLQELPEDLDVCIAQRDFEGAVDLVERVNEHLQGCPKSAAVKEYKARIEHRIKQLTEVLMHELEMSPERSLRGGPRAARRAITQLIRLGKSAQACDLFLHNRSRVIKYSVRQLKIEGNTTLYVKHLCEVFFGGLMDAGKEFSKAFPELFGCFSAFVVWAQGELDTFLQLFCQQVFVNKATLSTVSECVYQARRCCDELSSIGLELTFILDGKLLPEVERRLKENHTAQLEATKHRASEDLWRPVNFQNVEALRKFEEDMVEYGLRDIHAFSYDKCFTHLTANTINFTRAYLNYASHALRMYCPELHVTIQSTLVDILRAQVQHAERSMKCKDFAKQQGTIVQNATFLVDKLLVSLSNRYTDQTGQTLDNTATLRISLRTIKAMSSKNAPQQEEYV